MPVLLYRAQLDELIPASVSQAQLAEYCARGVRIRNTEVAAATHIPSGSLGAPSAVAWLADRFAGRPRADVLPLSRCAPDRQRPGQTAPRTDSAPHRPSTPSTDRARSVSQGDCLCGAGSGDYHG